MQGPVRTERSLTLVGDKATLHGVFEDSSFIVTFTDTERPPMLWTRWESSRHQGHGGGDYATGKVIELREADFTGHTVMGPPLQMASYGT
jgi:hypothetical protein